MRSELTVGAPSRQVNRGDLFMTGGLVICAVVALVFAFRPHKNSLPLTGSPIVHPIASPERLATNSSFSLGPPQAPVVLVEFSDFQCPYCAQLALTLDSLRERHHDSVRVIYRHFPLMAKHPMALAAAEAAECAGHQARFGPMRDVSFAHQEQFGTTPWTHFAALANVPDTMAVAACMRDPSVFARIQEDVAVGNRIGITGTPNLIIGNDRIEGSASLAFLDSMIEHRRQ